MIEFFCPGIPAPGGSKRAFVNKKTGKVAVVDDCARNGDWKSHVANTAQQAMDGRPPLSGPLFLGVTFYLPRPKSHFGTGKKSGVLKSSAPQYHTSKPDATKLLRACEDALKSICWSDDSQVSRQSVVKMYGDRPGALVRVAPLAGREGE